MSGMKTTLDSLVTVIVASCAIVITIVALSRRGEGQAGVSGSEADVTLTSKMWKDIWIEDAGSANKTAPAQLVVFADFQCPACRGFDGTVLPRMRERFGDRLAVVYRHWPLDYHPEANPAAIASECARAQGRFWQFHDTLFAQQHSLGTKSYATLAHEAGVPDTTLLRSCMNDPVPAATVDRDRLLAETLGADGTPTIVLNGVMLRSGALEGVLSAAIEKALGAGS